MLLNYEIAILLSMAAIVVNTLLEPFMILNWYSNLIDRLPEWLSFPLGRCEKCLSGQLAFWYYLISDFNEYNIFVHILFTTTTIFITLILTKLLWKLNR